MPHNPPPSGENASRTREDVIVPHAMEMTLGKLLERCAKVQPEKIAIVFHDWKLTYRQLNEDVNRMATGLVHLGVSKGDRIGLMLPRIPELVIGFLAVAKSGGIAVPVNFELSADGIRAVLERTLPRALIVAEQFEDQVRTFLTPNDRITVVTTGKSSDGWTSWTDLMERGTATDPFRKEEAGDVVYLNYTSGSSGNSKGAVTTHAHIYWNTVASVEALGLLPEDVHLCMFAPFAHPHELFARPLFLGGTMVLLENIYPKSLAKAIMDNQVTCVMGLAPMYENLLEVLDHKTYDLSSLRIPESGGMFTRPDLIERFRTKLGIPIIPVWGSTETTGIAIANRPGRDMVARSAGRPCPSYEVRIVGDDGEELPAGEIGEMVFKGPGVVQGYYEEQTDTAACFRDGWYCSGDLGRRDNQGNFFFVERKRGMMKVAGHKVFPLEIEQTLLDHPRIKEAAVISAKDRLRGEVPKAIIVLKNGTRLTEKEVFAFCRERLAHYKLPRIIEIREAIPKTGSGKIDKKILQMEKA